jgi:hypothetical protein
MRKKGELRCGVFLDYDGRRFVGDIGAWGIEMAKKITRSRPWTREQAAEPAREVDVAPLNNRRGAGSTDR